MTDDDFELVYVDEERPEPESKGVQVGRPPVAGGIEELYFGEHGPAEAYPDTPTGWQFFLEEAEAAEAEEEARLNPAVDYERPPESPEDFDFAQRVQAEAEAHASAAAYQAALVDEVRRQAAVEGVRGEEAVARAAGAVEEWRRASFAEWMAGGASIAQAFGALRDLDNGPAIEAALGRERALAFSASDASLTRWREGREAQARADAVAGRPQRPDVFASPGLQKMARAMERHAERQRVWQQGVEHAYRNQTRRY